MIPGNYIKVIAYFMKGRGKEMKKKIVSVLLCATMISSLLAGCGSSDSASTGDAAATEESSGSSDSAAVTTTDAGSGSVYLLNFKPETDDAWQALAETYTNETGVSVTVVTAADGQYKTTLQSELAKSEAPTIYNIGSTADCAEYANYIYDLSDSSIYEHLTDKSLALEYDGKVAAVANCYECYGIIYNKTILEGYCGLDGAVVSSVDEINSFDTLNAVATDINNRVDEINDALGTNLTEAFASAGLDSGSNWRFSGHLAGIALYYEFKDAGCDLVAGQGTVTGKYLDNFKNVWDMYVNTSSADPATLDSGALNAEQELGLGEAVFYQNGDWEYSAFAPDNENGYTVTTDDLSMMPIYFGVDDANEGLAVGTENHWAVNSQASQEDIDSTLAFLDWVITSDEGRDAITNTMGLTAPFDTFTGEFESKNGFASMVNEYAAAGKTSVAWSFNATPAVDDWRADFVAPLTEYTERGGSWDDVKTAFVDQWTYYWDLSNE
jgi:raffinose/stachyose/melibiose transport system substrate-binding protein